jgi:4-amino-4-deoxy-L-arabinose transferase-like glycosyltransferase
VTGRERERALIAAAVLFALAVAPRALVVWQWGGEAPVWDGHYYDFGARRIAAGFGYSDDVMIAGRAVWHPWCHYPVGYSAFLGAFYRVFGATQAVADVVNVVTGALLAPVTFALARHGLSFRRAAAAGALVALSPGLVVYAALSMTEPLAALLSLAAFWVAVEVRRPWLGLAAGALVLGLAALVRPQALMCAPFLGLVVVRARGAPLAARLRVGALGAAVACVVALVPVLPWTARNCRVMDGCALVSTNAGWNLAIGAFPRATGRFETLRSSDGCREVTGQVQQDRCWLAYGLHHIQATPGRWLALVPKKLAYTFDHESFPVEYLREARPKAWPEERRVAVRGLLTASHRALVCAAALGFVAIALRRRTQVALAFGVALAAYLGFQAAEPTFWPLAAFAALLPWLPLPGRPRARPALLMPVALLGTTIVAHAVFFGEDRYHMVVTPALCILAAAALRRPG